MPRAPLTPLGAGKCGVPRSPRTTKPGSPPPTPHVAFGKMPRHTAEAPCHSWKSVTETSRFTRPFHQTSRFAGFVYTNDSRATVLGGAGVPKRVGYRASPTNVPAPAEAPAIALALSQSRRVQRLDSPAVFAPHGAPFSSLPIAFAVPVLELRVRIEGPEPSGRRVATAHLRVYSKVRPSTNRQSMRSTPSPCRIERQRRSAQMRPTVARRMNTA